MTMPPREPWTQERFFAWAEAQDAGYEFDGVQPVAMPDGNVAHSLITRNLLAALHTRLRGSDYHVLGLNAGLATVGEAVRYPDALVTCSKFEPTDRTIPDVVVVFEVLGPGSGHTDRIVKFREYTAVPSIRRYVVLESTSVGLTVLERTTPDEAWRLIVLMTSAEVLGLPEIGIDVPVAELYEDITFPEDEVALT